MLEVALWYAALQLVGLAALPVTFRLFGRLPGRGYAFARPLGLLLSGYGLFIAASFGLLDNRPAAAWLVVAGLGLAGWGCLRREVAEIADLWRRRASLVLAVEALFLAAYLGLCLVRAQVPEIAATEKPMEFAFLNAVVRSERFPPADPWLSGYSISYYYFGYLLATLLVWLSGVSTGVAFNLMLATLFALTATGAFALGFDLVAGTRARAAGPEGGSAGLGAWLTGALSTVFVLLLANWEGALELLHAHGLGSPAFWRWVGIGGLDRPFQSDAWYPTDQQSMWWWFRAARVIATSGADGKALDYTINEFPAFSFLLGDLHPHVLALPFTFLALAFALSLLRSPAGDWAWRQRPAPRPGWLDWTGRAPVLDFALSHLVLYPVEALRRWPLAGPATAILFGGLGFLNAWDLPTYLFVLVGSFALARYLARPRLDALWRREVLTFGWLVLFGSLVAYFPLYLGLRSQAAGLGVVGYRSQLHHFAIFWGPLLLLVASFLVVQLRRAIVPERPGLAVVPRAGDWPGRAWPIVLALAAALVLFQVPPLAERLPFWVQAPALAVVLPLVVASAALIWRYLTGALAPVKAGAARAVGGVPASLAPEHVFVLGLAFTALLLISGTELVFIRDLFGNRMNTVFKLYYQAWAMLAIVAAYGVHYLTARWPRPGAPVGSRVGAWLWATVGVLAVAAGLIYPLAGVLSRAGSSAAPPTLDGTAYLARTNPSDYAAIRWLQANVEGNPVIVEASGGSYSQFGRVSAHTGLPTILGWDFHETQWRGDDAEGRRRQADLDRIYRSGDRATVEELLARYGVTYVYVGPLEVEKYGRPDGASLEQLATFLDVAYAADGVTIYQVRSRAK